MLCDWRAKRKQAITEAGRDVVDDMHRLEMARVEAQDAVKYLDDELEFLEKGVANLRKAISRIKKMNSKDSEKIVSEFLSTDTDKAFRYIDTLTERSLKKYKNAVNAIAKLNV